VPYEVKKIMPGSLNVTQYAMQLLRVN